MTDQAIAKRVNEALLLRRVPHGNFIAALERGKELLKLRDLGMPGSGFLLYGESGVGKTALTEALVAYGNKHFGPDAVIRTQLSSGATTKAMLSGLLAAFGDAKPDKGSASQLVTRLKGAVKERGCRLLEIDETNHLMPGGNAPKALIDNILNALKILDETGVSFILSGMPSILTLWTADKQIRSRFRVTYELEALRYPGDRPAWRGIIAKFLDDIERNGMTVDCPGFPDRLHAACNGLMRPLVLILTTAVAIACERKSLKIEARDLDSAVHRQIDKLDGLVDAFDLDMEEVTRHSQECHSSKALAPTARGLNDILRQ